MKQIKKVLLLYSGGLDTSVILKWIQETYKAEVVTFTANVGQETESTFDKIKEKAAKAGAVACEILDLREEFINDYIVPSIKANAFYQGVYPISTSVARYLIAIKAVEAAKKHGCDAISHGSTGKGNDQVRFDITIKALDPNLEIIRPIIEWGMGRDDEIKYAQEHGIEVLSANKTYSTDENLWGRSIECGPMEHPDQVPPRESTSWIAQPEQWPNEPEYVKIGFKQGIPVAFNDEAMKPIDVVMKCHAVGCKHGVGWIQHMEDRVVGLKSRETYEVPAAAIIIPAHKELEKYVSTRSENAFKPLIDQRWTEMAYDGLWLDPLMNSLTAFIDEFNIKVTGSAKVRLFKGSAAVVAVDSPYGIYNLNLATYDTNSNFNQKASYGFIELFGLSTRMGYQTRQRMLKDINKK
jgi:argininosuccinate synthase